MGRYVLGDFFTTIHGQWEVSNSRWSITPDMLEKYGNDDIPGRGCSNCLFAKLVGGPGTKVRFFTRDNGIIEKEEIGPGGWAHYAGMHGSGSSYNPDRGEQGWWNMMVEDANTEVGGGYGMPNNEHVSSFQVFVWEEGAEEDPEDPTEQIPDGPDPLGSELRIMLGGVTILDGYFTPRS
jgi:hypothetical protein